MNTTKLSNITVAKIAAFYVWLGLLISCATIQETARDDEIPDLIKLAKAAGPVTKPTWEQTVEGHNVDFIEYIDANHVLVTVLKLVHGDILWGMGTAEPAQSAISLYNVQTGQREWTRPLKQPSGVNAALQRYQVIATKPHIILLANDSKTARFEALDVATGNPLWQHEFNIPVVTAFSTSGESLFVAKIKDGKDLALNGININTGKLLWQRKIEQVVAGENSVKLRSIKDALYVVGKEIHAINMTSGADIWVKKSGLNQQQILDVSHWADNILIHSLNQALAVSRADGKEVWSYSDSNYQIQNILVQPKAIYVSEKSAGNNSEARIVALDSANGRNIWRYGVKGEVRSPLIIADNGLFYTTACCINKLNPGTGRLTSSTSVPGYFHAKYDIVLPDMITLHNDTVVVARETYGVVAVSAKNNKITFDQPAPVSLTHRYFTSDHYDHLLGRLKYFSKKLHDEEILKQQTYVKQSTQSMLIPLRVDSQRMPNIASSYQFELTQARREYRTATNAGARDLAKQKMTQISQARTSEMGIEAAGSRVSHAVERMMARIDFMNSVTGTYFAVIEAMHKARYKAAVEKLQTGIDHALYNHQRSFQQGYYVRPFMADHYAGVILVDLDTGKRVELRHSAYTYDMDEDGLKVPSVAVHPQQKEIFVEGISLNPETYVQVDIGKHRIPYTSVRRFDMSSLPFIANAPNPDLIKAVEDGKVDIVREILSVGSGALTLKEYGGSALVKAAESNQLAIASELIARGVDANSFKGEGPIIAAVKNQDLPMVKLLVKHGADVNAKKKLGKAPIDIAGENGDIEMMRFLMKSGAKLDTNSFGGGPLTSAARKGKAEMVRSLIELGVNVNEKSFWGTPLSSAASEGHLEVVQMLIQAGANVNIPADTLHPLTSAKRSLSACSPRCKEPYDKIIELLVKAGSKEPVAKNKK